MANYRDRLEYSLAKQVTDMERGFVIQTSYGDLEIAADQAAPIIKAVRAALERDLKRLERAMKMGGAA